MKPMAGLIGLALILMCSSTLRGQVPQMISYQGKVMAYGTNFTGTGQFKFALVNATGLESYWSHDGSSSGGSEPKTAVPLEVTNGLFMVMLGDTATLNMTVPIPANIFANIDVRLRVWFSGGAGEFQQLAPDQRVGAVGFAYQAEKANLALAVAEGAISRNASLVGSGGGTALGLNLGNANTWTAPQTFLGGLAGNGSGLTSVNAATLGGYAPNELPSYWNLLGNAGTTTASFLGTTDPQPLELRVNGQRALRLEWTTDGAGNASPNLIGGAPINSIGSGVVGATIGGGFNNSIQTNASYATVAGGQGNEILWFGPLLGSFSIPTNSSIGGGCNNSLYVPNSVISGGASNHIGSPYSNAYDSGHSIGGGARNSINYQNSFSAIAGGLSNRIDGSSATVAGGSGNSICWAGPNFGNAIGGGVNNSIQSSPGSSVISGGYSNAISNTGYGAIGGGISNKVGGYCGTVPGGDRNEAAFFSFGAGHRAKANTTGSFVWADSTEADFASTTNNEFAVRSSGGVQFFTDAGATVGVQVAAGGNAWSPMSDRNQKENFKLIEPRAVLAKVAALPVTEWNLKTQPAEIRHIGPMAQDFKAAFGLGEDDRHISTSDADGVMMAAIQGLHQIVQEQKTQLQARDEEIASLERRLAELESMVKRRGE